MNVYEARTADLKPYPRNTKLHSPQQIQNVAESIKRYGFVQPVVVDQDNVIIIGHCRTEAAKLLGLQTVPAVKLTDLTEEEINALRIVDNKTNESEWDDPVLIKELEKIDLSGFNFHFDIEEPTDWFADRKRFDNEGIENESEEYQAFVEKFEPKRTTDDCYTPDLIYDAIAQYVVDYYHVDRERFLRPFYPGGDYEHEDYPKDCIVVDNPPFSILSEIERFYNERGIKFFLFAPSVTALSRAIYEAGTAICATTKIVYENGATVLTNFHTNLDDPDIVARTDPELYQIIEEASEKLRAETTTPQRKYEYPDNVVTAAMLDKLAKYGQKLEIRRNQCIRISALDHQKENGDAIYGGGLLLSEKAAAEKAAAEKAAAEKAAAEKAVAEKWHLSEREKEIIASFEE